MTYQDKLNTIDDFRQFLWKLKRPLTENHNLFLDCDRCLHELGRIEHEILVQIGVRESKNKI